MAASPLKQYLDRSVGLLWRNTAKVMRMDISSKQPPLPILTFASSSASSSSPQTGRREITPLTSLAQGCDADIGGLSTCALTPVPSPQPTQDHSQSQSHAAFHGNLSLVVPPAYQGKIRTGYAAFRTKTRPSLFGDETWDLSLYSHLRVVVGYRGWEGWRDRWVLNIQTDGPVRSDLFQHRLSLPSSPQSTSSPAPLDPHVASPDGSLESGWSFSTLHLPLSSFVLTNSGETAAQQIPMMRTKVRTIGFALLGGGRSTEDASAPALSTSAARAQAQAEVQRMGAGGWRGGQDAGEVEVDKELEELMRSDLPYGQDSASAASRPAVNSSGSGGGGGGSYHRVGTTVAPANTEQPITRFVDSSDSPAGVEGYYELCIKSVEAVTWDPESDDADDA